MKTRAPEIGSIKVAAFVPATLCNISWHAKIRAPLHQVAVASFGSFQFRASNFQFPVSSFEFRIVIVANGLLKIYALVPIGVGEFGYGSVRRNRAPAATRRGSTRKRKLKKKRSLYMALSILNNIPSLMAQNELNITNANLQTTLFQLSSGSRINSGADDPAGLSIANGMQANISALTQSSQNATEGVGQLQVADGALSQVTTLLNRAVTLATEAANGGLTTPQYSAITNEYNSIVNEIDQIGSATNFNGSSVFQSASIANPNVSDSQLTNDLAATTGLTSGKTFTLNLGSTAYTYTPGTASTPWYQGNQNLGTGTTQLGSGNAITITNSAGQNTFTANIVGYGTTGLTLTPATTFTATDTVTVSQNGHNHTTANTLTTVGALMSDINTWGQQYGISAYLSGGNLEIAGNPSGGTLTASGNAGFTTDVGALTANATTTVNGLIGQINNSSATTGLTAYLDSNGYLNIQSSQGNIAISNNTLTALGTLSPTSTVQNLVNWVNANVPGVTAGIAGVPTLNEVSSQNGGLNSSTTTFTGGTLTITSGAGGTNSLSLTINNGETLGQLMTAIGNGGKGFSAMLNSTGHLLILDTNGNNDIAATATGNAATVLGTFGEASINQLVITDTENRGNLSVTDYDTALGAGGTAQNPTNAFAAPIENGPGGVDVFISDGETPSAYTGIDVSVGPLSATQIGSNSTTLSTQNLGSASGGSTALGIINNAISYVAAMRGTIGAGINRLNSATNVINTQVQNLTSAQSSIMDANVGQVVANLSKYQVLEQTGIAALAQANTQQQVVLKLLQ
jgi:flagellin